MLTSVDNTKMGSSDIKALETSHLLVIEMNN